MKDELTEEHLDPTAEISLETVKARAVKGVAVLTGRTFVLSVISLVATGLLTVFLDPSEFGVFWLVSAVVNFLAYFSDVGLAAALIQKKENVTRLELVTTFTIQQGLVISLLTLLFLLSPFVTSYYQLSNDGRMLLYALGFSLLLSSFKTIPSVLLERKLDFPRLVVPQVLENLAYNVVAVVLAWQGFGVTSFTYAVLVRGVIGVIALYWLMPWKPGIAFSKPALKKLLSYGVPYQANTLLAVVKDDGMTLVLGGILGTAGVGLLGWAQKWAFTPLRLFMDHVLKVTFPAFSRMQDEKIHLERSITRSIFFVCFLVFPASAGLLILAPVLVDIIPRYEKWEPALIPLALISVNTYTAAATTQLTNLLNAIGKIKTTFFLMIMWTVLTWAFVPFLSIRYGVNGAALGYALVGLSSFVAIGIVKRIINFSLTESVVKPFIATVVMSVVLIFIRSLLSTSLTTVWVLGIVGVFIYFSLMFKLVGASLLADVKKGTRSVISRS